MSLSRDGEWVRLLLEEAFAEFNRKAVSQAPDLENKDLRSLDLRAAHLRRANLRGAYLRDCDLRGLDLSEADLEGASIHSARLAGTYFPAGLSPGEITLSHSFGTRLRVRRGA
jgi:uncharacterized protein YjbI with pentapeptide repeats